MVCSPDLWPEALRHVKKKLLPVLSIGLRLKEPINAGCLVVVGRFVLWCCLLFPLRLCALWLVLVSGMSVYLVLWWYLIPSLVPWFRCLLVAWYALCLITWFPYYLISLWWLSVLYGGGEGAYLHRLTYQFCLDWF